MDVALSSGNGPAMWVNEGRIIEIDLGHGGVREVGALEAYSAVLGGRGLSQALLVERISPGTGPFDPECPVVFGAGLLCGTDAPGAARLSIDSVNPFTGGSDRRTSGAVRPPLFAARGSRVLS